MDQSTIHAYNQDAVKIAKLHASLVPYRLYELIQTYFIAHGKTLDAGCGIGRDSFFLQQNNFGVIGVDASHGMLEQAKSLYPSVRFFQEICPACIRCKIRNSIMCCVRRY
jgi:SAM-dependent methyltransferase